MGLEPGFEGLEGSFATGGVVRPVLVVARAEGVELKLQMGKAFCCRLAAEEALEGLVKALDLAAGLRVLGAGVTGDDAEAVEL